MPSNPQPRPWWHPDRHADRRPFLAARGRIVKALRAWFEAQGFVEVETAALQVSPGNEAHLHAFATELISPDGAQRPMYLATSPEFAAKKLLAAAEERIFTFAQAFRNRERGALHHPAFTMLEWYRAREPYERLMEDCAEILRIAAEAAGTETLQFRGVTADPRLAPNRITVAQAFERWAGIDLLATLPGAGPPSPRLPSGHPQERATHSEPEGMRGEGIRAVPDRDALATAANRVGIRTEPDDSWGDVFSRVLVALVEPTLAERGPTILTEYPACSAALARRKPSDPRVAERFELYACGVELANAFGEQTDPAEQHRRLEEEMAEKERRYGERYPIDEDFLAALALMPPASGAALGFDRLVMLATGASHIEQVLWTPIAGG